MKTRPAWPLVVAGAIAATLLLAAVEFVRGRWTGSTAAAAPATTGSLRIVTRPEGAEVLINGERRGATPLTLSLNPGSHTLAVRAAGQERTVPVTIAAGTSVEQHFDMNVVAAAVLGTMSVVTTPAGARVTIDGRMRGVTPLTLADLPAGEHRVLVERGSERAQRAVTVQPGATASVVFALANETGPVGGWLTVASPFEVQVIEDAEVIGASATSRIMLAAGRHELTLVNTSLEYSEQRTVEITPGRVTAVKIDPPRAALNVNARPWADVLIDNAEAGQTPIANLAVTVGTHQITFRHPQFGERRQTIVVTAKGPNRVSVDLTK